MNSLSIQSVVCALAAIVLSSCASPKTTKDLVADAGVEKEISALMHQQGGVPKLPGIPVIDVHTHLFNSRYLPAQGVIASREDDLLTFWSKLGGLIVTGHWVRPSELREIGNLMQLATPTDDAIKRKMLPDPDAVERLARRKAENDWKEYPLRLIESWEYRVARRRQDILRERLMRNMVIRIPPAGSRRLMSPGVESILRELENQGLIEPVSAAHKALWLSESSRAHVAPATQVVYDAIEARVVPASVESLTERNSRVVTQKGLNRVLKNVEHLTGIIEHQDPRSFSTQNTPYRHTRTALEGAYWFALHLIAGETELVRAMTETENSRVDAFVYMMMHMAPSFQMQSAKEPLIYDYASVQLPRAAKVDAMAEGRGLHFVAWNPFVSKDDFSSANPRALEIVKQGIAMGAKGVKFYPPMGYRPAGNAECGFPVAPDKKRNPLAYEQWQGRYEGWHPSDLDALNARLFRWCVANNIPVFAHCNHGDMRADSGEPNYGELAHPKYWAKLLEQREFHELRLCLGHAGGADYWVGIVEKPDEDFTGWGREVVGLCLRYPNVYCEVGIHADVANAGLAARFVARLQRVMPMRCAEANRTFADKIMYGSDWYMPVPETTSVYLNSFLAIFQTRAMKDYYSKFFCTNAMRYLNLPEGSVSVRSE